LKKDQGLARRDFDEVRKIDPSNPVLLRGEAVLSMDAGDMPAAVARLTEALRRNPKDPWALNVRAEAYRRSGEMEKAQADMDRLRQLMSEMSTVEAAKR
jgi:Flp pilus assembly protein TadD